MTTDAESIRRKFRVLGTLWKQAAIYQHHVDGTRHAEGDAYHSDALKLENELVALCSPGEPAAECVKCGEPIEHHDCPQGFGEPAAEPRYPRNRSRQGTADWILDPSFLRKVKDEHDTEPECYDVDWEVIETILLAEERLRHAKQPETSSEPAAEWQGRVATAAITLRETARMLETSKLTRAACVSAMLKIAGSISPTQPVQFCCFEDCDQTPECGPYCRAHYNQERGWPDGQPETKTPEHGA